MILSTGLSIALLAMSEGGRCPVDAVEVGPYLAVERLKRYRAELPGWRFYYHPGNLLSALHVTPFSLRRVRAYMAWAPTPWLSCHLSLLPPAAPTLALRYRLFPLPKPDRERSRRQILARTSWWQSKLGVPLILENMPLLPDVRGLKYRLEADPQWISDIIAASGCRFLLDLAHARIAASRLGCDVRHYLRCLPLDRVVQLHVSGPRTRDGFLYDAHEPMEPTDYELLEWVLGHTTPQVLTLEYFREREALELQIAEIRAIVVS